MRKKNNKKENKEELKAPYVTFGPPILKIKGVGIVNKVNTVVKLEDLEIKK